MKQVIQILWDFQAGKCIICNETMLHPNDFKPVKGLCKKYNNHPLSITKEHIIPISKGGLNGRNMLLAHRQCNSARTDKSLPYNVMQRVREVVSSVIKYLDESKFKWHGWNLEYSHKEYTLE